MIGRQQLCKRKSGPGWRPEPLSNVYKNVSGVSKIVALDANVNRCFRAGHIQRGGGYATF
jgi:hypothetical protein